MTQSTNVGETLYAAGVLAFVQKVMKTEWIETFVDSPGLQEDSRQPSERGSQVLSAESLTIMASTMNASITHIPKTASFPTNKT
jgi:hypothetical protein